MFSRQLSLIFRLMRILPILFLCFCSLISGWTAALAQIQMLPQPAQHEHVAHADMAVDDACCDDTKTDSKHHDKQVHPLLCAACFAVETAALELRPHARSSVRLRPWLQKAMIAAGIEPLHPPPKA